MRTIVATMSIAVLCSLHLLPEGTCNPVEQTILVARDREKRWKTQRDVLREAREFHSSGGKLMHLTFSRTAIQRFRDTAFVYSDYVVELSVNGKSKVSRGRATEVFVLKGGKWINPGWHTDSQ
jgi:hypothetical protein